MWEVGGVSCKKQYLEYKGRGIRSYASGCIGSLFTVF